MTEDLKPCPFCGSENTSCDGHFIQCSECHSSGPSFYPCFNHEFVIKAWNHRVESDTLIKTVQMRIAELEEQIEENCTYRSRELVDHEITALKWVLSLKKED